MNVNVYWGSRRMTARLLRLLGGNLSLIIFIHGCSYFFADNIWRAARVIFPCDLHIKAPQVFN